MSYSTTPSIRAAIFAASLAATAFFGGCAGQPAAELTQADKMLILEEIDLGSSLVGYEQPQLTTATGPNLIAGDWLAIQCASAGGYFDLDFNNADWSPVFANVVTSQYE